VGTPSGWVCNFEESPAFLFPSSSDQTGTIPGLVCRRVEGKLPGSSLTSWAGFWKLLRRIGEFPLP
jgi:hypothetical protein